MRNLRPEQLNLGKYLSGIYTTIDGTINIIRKYLSVKSISEKYILEKYFLKNCKFMKIFSTKDNNIWKNNTLEFKTRKIITREKLHKKI